MSEYSSVPATAGYGGERFDDGAEQLVTDLTSTDPIGAGESSTGGDDAVDPVAEEQDHLTLLYRRLDALRRERVELRDRYVRHSDGTPGGRVERDVAYARHAAAVLTLNAAEDRLCFGRIDHTDGESMHIGRMGIFNDTGDHRQLLMDWRAPSARPFYVATAANPLGIRRRRYIQTRRRRVESVTDDHLVLAGGTEGGSATAGLAGEAALLSAIQAPRTGRMSDIVATIQAEQDRIIRADRNGILVVQGGPGTGKTAVALHRAAYLLYTHREQLGQRGVLIIGPNPTFLKYIGQVLPSLGENAVVLSTVGDLFPGVSARAEEDARAARIKGRTAMTTVIANAVLHRESMPGRAVRVKFDGAPGGVLHLHRGLFKAAQDRAWQSRRPHNQARSVFIRRVMDALVPQVAERLGRGPDGESLATSDDLDAIRGDLLEHEGLAGALRGIWPALTARRLVADLFASPERIAFAANHFSPADRKLLERPIAAGGWTAADVPLLDEAAELLGPVGQERLAADAAAELEYAGEVLDLMGVSSDQDETYGDEAPLVSMVSAANLASLHNDVVTMTSTAERAAADREWAFGHVIVDEAQELSPMAWRMVMRRCPVRSMTLVGDLAQTSDAAGASSWDRVLKPYARQQLRIEELTVNYRTPAEIMDVAEPTLARIDPEAQPPRSVRESGVAPWHRQVDAADLAEVAAALAAQDHAEAGDGTLAIIVPHAVRDAVAAAVHHATHTAEPGDGSEDLRDGVSVLTVRDAKGLEFDRVIVADPNGILTESDRGLNDLYVALTRATQQLGVLHTGPLPVVLHRLKGAAACSALTSPDLRCGV